jgi:hypothetical protein
MIHSIYLIYNHLQAVGKLLISFTTFTRLNIKHFCNFADDKKYKL